MAGRYKYNTALYTLTCDFATSEATNFPKERLTSFVRVNRPWRSTDTTEQELVFDFQSGKTQDAIVLHRCNFTSVQLEWSAAGTPGGGSPHVGSPFTVSQDLKDGYYKLIVEDLTPVTFRYLHVVIPNQATTDGAAYFQLGAVFVGGALTEIGANPQRPTDESRIQHVLRAPIGADEDVVEVGAALFQDAWFLQPTTDANVDEWRTLRNLGVDAPVLWWYNQGTADVYLMRHAGVAIKSSDTVNEVAVTWRQIG